MNILAHDPRSRKEGICFSGRGARMFTTHDAPLDLMHVERPVSCLYRFYRSLDSVKVGSASYAAQANGCSAC